MEDLKALMERPECCWGYIDELRMALASACKERDEARKELHAMRNELCCTGWRMIEQKECLEWLQQPAGEEDKHEAN